MRKTISLCLLTIGCRLNQAESQDLAEALASAGFSVVSGKAGADILIVNTCAVTHVAARKSRQSLRIYHHRWPRAKIVVWGCSEPELKKMPEVDLAIPLKDKARTADIIVKKFGAFLCQQVQNQKLKTGKTLLSNGRTRVLLKIQDGCDEFCTYCIVPFRRGKPHSVPGAKILGKVKQIESMGGKEIVLTGVHIGSYHSQGLSLAGLVKKILTQTQISRIRFSSIEPQHLSPEILKLFRQPRICPFLHLPIQSGSDRVLKMMKRRYSAKQLMALIARIKKTVPGVFMSTDVIVGFPGESETDFRRTAEFCRLAGFAKIHVFSYSNREGTEASHYPGQLCPEVIVGRSRRLRRLSDQLNLKYRRSQLGKKVTVLLETSRSGLSPAGLKINFDSDGKTNTLVTAKIMAVTANQTLATLISQ